jgi:ABC-type multidrug transport system fused ATPase/permease subunit
MTTENKHNKTNSKFVTILLRIPEWIGTPWSLILHTIIFGGFLVSPWVFGIQADSVFIVFTTILSLEAIYLAIFIQMSINRNNQEIAELQEDLEEIQEDIEEITEDVEEINVNVDEIQEDIEDIEEDDDKIGDLPIQNKAQLAANQLELAELKTQLAKILTELEKINKK